MAYYRHIGLIGKAGAGKDTVAERLWVRFGYQRIAFADPLKAVALAVDPVVYQFTDRDEDGEEQRHNVRLSWLVDDFGWDRAKRNYPEVRRLLQTMGAAVRGLDADAWVRAALDRVDRWDNVARPVVVTDVRYRNEADALTARGFLLVRILRPGAGLEGEGAAHPSETELDDYVAGVPLSNVGTLTELHRAVDALPLLR